MFNIVNDLSLYNWPNNEKLLVKHEAVLFFGFQTNWLFFLNVTQNLNQT